MWALAGCGGCGLLALVAALVLGFFTFRLVSDVSRSVGPVSEQQVRQSLGPEVPLPPGARLDPAATQGLLVAFRTTERVTRQAPGSLLRAAGFFRTPEPPERVIAFYEQALKARGWAPAGAPRTGARMARTYARGQERLIVDVRPDQEGGSRLILMRGGPGLVGHAPPP